MLQHLRIHSAQECTNLKCSRLRRPASTLEKFCPECGQELDPKFETNWRLALPLAAAAVVILVILVLIANAIRAGRAEERETQLLARAERRLAEAVIGVTTADVEAIIDHIQEELGLDDALRDRLVEKSRFRLLNLPQPLEGEPREQLELLLRKAYRDSSLSAVEQDRIDELAAAERLLPKDVEELQSAVARRAETVNHHLSRGKTLVARGELEEARAEFLRATEADPRDPLAWTQLGAVNAVLGRRDEAFACYDTALSLQPRQWLAHYNLGLLAVRDGDVETGLTHLERSVASLPATAARERRALIQELLDEPALETLRGDPRFADLLSIRSEIPR